MIKFIKQKGDVYAPIITCDCCNQPINDGKGQALLSDSVVTEGSTVDVYFTHTGCDHSMEQKLREQGIDTMWMGLDMFLLYLVNNTNVNLDRATKQHKLYKDHGLAR